MDRPKHDGALTPRVKAVYELVNKCYPLLHGQPPEVVGAALADLLAIWLAGHVVLGDEKATEAARERRLAEHIISVRGLIPIEYKKRIEPTLKGRK